jgi:hypothetical protein
MFKKTTLTTAEQHSKNIVAFQKLQVFASKIVISFKVIALLSTLKT